MSSGPSRTAAIAAVAIIGLLAVTLVILNRVLPEDTAAPAPTQTRAPRTGPVAVPPVEAPDAESAHCAALLAALPGSLQSGKSTLDTLPMAEPAPVGARAWGDRIAAPVVLRCGLPKPAELTPTSALREVSKVQWLVIEGVGGSTWIAVDRPVHVALTLPDGVGTGPLQTVSEVVAATLPAQTVKP